MPRLNPQFLTEKAGIRAPIVPPICIRSVHKPILDLSCFQSLPRFVRHALALLYPSGRTTFIPLQLYPHTHKPLGDGSSSRPHRRADTPSRDLAGGKPDLGRNTASLAYPEPFVKQILPRSFPIFFCLSGRAPVITARTERNSSTLNTSKFFNQGVLPIPCFDFADRRQLSVSGAEGTTACRTVPGHALRDILHQHEVLGNGRSRLLVDAWGPFPGG